LGLGVSHWRAISRWSEDPGTLARWECGEQAPRLDFAERIKEFLAISEVPSLSTNAGIA
jgi:transcriptional regulator with XRE-family HTH domain